MSWYSKSHLLCLSLLVKTMKKKSSGNDVIAEKTEELNKD